MRKEIEKMNDGYKWLVYNDRQKVVRIGKNDTEIGAMIAADLYIGGCKEKCLNKV